ncbi:MAG: hypothetical protein HC771_22970 [Synechococcales cyanobacterium CRU_2_2]|nr:hypothetical protein [Synechococcales cyanobacterium CRU_2_2]
MVLTRFAKFCGEEFDLAGASRGYSLDKVERYIPSDDEVVNWWHKIPGTSPWRNFYGLLACYGLRPHEAFLGQTEWVDLGGDRRVLGFRVSEACKTGERLVAPIPKEWASLFGLLGEFEMPKVSRNFGQVGARQFKRMKIPFSPYSLRHRYSLAGNTSQGLGTSTVAALMGHSPATNQRVYQRHLDGPWAWRNYKAIDERLDKP